MSSAFGAYAVGPSVYNAGDVIQRVVEEYDPSAAQGLSTTHADVDGSDYTFTPKRADSEIIYKYFFAMAGEPSAALLGHFKLLVDGTLEAESETTIFSGNSTYTVDNQDLVTYEFVVQSWGTTAKTIKLQAREYDASNQVRIHGSLYWDGSPTTAKLRRATLEIQEIATTGGNHGDYDISHTDTVGAVTDFLTADPPAGWLELDGSSLSDSTYSDLYNVITFVDSTVDTTNADATCTMDDTSRLMVGTLVEGTGITAGTTVASITNGTTFELSANATATNSNQTMRFKPWGGTATNFSLPDLRGLFRRAWDNSAGVDTDRVLGTEQDDELKAHAHTYGGVLNLGQGVSARWYANGNSNTTGSTGGSETRPKNFAVLTCIKY